MKIQHLIAPATVLAFALTTSVALAQTTTGSTTSTSTTNSAVVNLDTAPTVPAGSNDVALANISLGGGLTSATRISAIPLSISPGNGASLADLTGCHIRSAITPSGGSALSNQFPLANAGATAFTLGTPLTLATGGATMLSLACNVQPATPAGGSFTISIDPKTVVATDFSGNPVTLAATTGTGPNGLPASTSGVVTVTAFAGSSGGTTTGTGTGSTGSTGGSTGSTSGTPGVPNTGSGGTAGSIMFVLALAAIAALLGAAYLRFERATLD